MRSNWHPSIAFDQHRPLPQLAFIVTILIFELPLRQSSTQPRLSCRQEADVFLVSEVGVVGRRKAQRARHVVIVVYLREVVAQAVDAVAGEDAEDGALLVVEFGGRVAAELGNLGGVEEGLDAGQGEVG